MTDLNTPDSDKPIRVSAFDFDGTITCRDSFITYLLWLKGPAGLAQILLKDPDLGVHYLKTKDRGRLKSHILYNILGNISKEELKASFQDFQSQFHAKLIRPDALSQWQKDKALGLITGIVTASPTLLVAPFAEALGADFILGTELGFDENHRLMADLAGPNCRCEQKPLRLQAHFGPKLCLIRAYGDTKGDLDMLKAAQNGYYRVFKQRP